MVGGRMSGFDGKTYPYRLTIDQLNEAGEAIKTIERTLELTRVSTVSKIIDKSDMLIAWAYNGGLEGVLELLGAEVDVSAMTVDELKAAMKAAGHSPFVRRARAADRGTAAHDVLEKLARGVDRKEINAHIVAIPSEEWRGYCWAAVGFWDDNTPETILAEEPVVSLRYGFAGTFDLFALRDAEGGTPRGILTDAKTSKDVYPEMALQLGGYAIGIEETYGHQVDAASILLLRADGSYREIFITPDRKGFLDALELTRAMEVNKEAVKAARKENR